MRLSEILDVLSDTDRIRIIEGERGNDEPQQSPQAKILFSGYKGMIVYFRGDKRILLMNPVVKRFECMPEIRHRKYKERGLMPPYEPAITRLFEFSDLTMFIYYDIYVSGEEPEDNDRRQCGTV